MRKILGAVLKMSIVMQVIGGVSLTFIGSSTFHVDLSKISIGAAIR